MDSFSSHTLVQLLYNLHLQDVEIQNVTLPQSELNDPINSHHFDQVVHYGAMITLIWVPGSWHVHLHHQFRIQCQWYRDHYGLVLFSARGTRVWMWLLTETRIHARAVTVTKEY